MRLLFTVLFASVISLFALSQVSMSYYLPDEVDYDTDIPTPEDVLGYVPGQWHVSHDQLLYYMREVADASDRIMIEPYAKSYEGRPLIQLIITSPENHNKMASILDARQAVKSGQPPQSPLVVQLGYSVHGNEASGSNAALLTAYYLAAAWDEGIDKMLQETIIVLDPCYNPDGLNRFASWVNTHKSQVINPDPNDREYNEAWPGGRTNHYWFDLNRDWLLVQHPESQGRIRQFHRWMPHILTDHHEMGTSSTFFFQPGIPSRKFPNTDDKNQALTAEIATYHANALDSIGSLYYSKESFDDFYIGKGSTYPDVNGSIGILFEQASARGHAQENPYGVLTFPFAIRNHFVSSLSTLAASQAMKDRLKKYQSEQYRDAANWDEPGAYVFGDVNDPMKTFELVKLLKNHDITVNQLSDRTAIEGKEFLPGSAFVVSMQQPQARLIKSVFETRKTFTDSLFYDVSTWTLQLAFDLPYASVSSRKAGDLMGQEAGYKAPPGEWTGTSDYAYAFETNGYYAHRAIQRLLDEDVIIRVTHKFHQSQNKSLGRGAVIIPLGVQRDKTKDIEKILKQVTKKDGIDIYPLNTGLAVSGADLGSPSMSKIENPEIAVLVGSGVSSYEAGEVWHVLDQRVKVKVTLLETEDIRTTELSKYNRLVMPNGYYSRLDEGVSDKIKNWVQAGGVLVTWKNGARWLANHGIAEAKFKKSEQDTTGYKKYGDYRKTSGAKYTGGSIFEAKADLTHPLAYGLTRPSIPLFRNHNLILKKSSNPYAHPLVYADNALLSGYVHPTNLDRINGSPAAQITSLGAGRVIILADNPNFRAFWYGTNKLFFNALYFGHTISSGTAR